MSMPRRKIGYYSLTLQDKQNDESIIEPHNLRLAIKWMAKLPMKRRLEVSNSSKKAHTLVDVQEHGRNQVIVFGAAKFDHRPPLLNVRTGFERDNPKNREEGEEELTHAILTYRNEHIGFMLEERRAGISKGGLVNYLRRAATLYYRKKHDSSVPFDIELAVVRKGDFAKELMRTRRIKVGEVFTDKRILGSGFLNYANRTRPVKNTIMLKIGSALGADIKETLGDIYGKFTGERKEIVRIRAYGSDDDGNDVVLDTDIVKMVEFVEVELDKDRGTVDSADMIAKMLALAD